MRPERRPKASKTAKSVDKLPKSYPNSIPAVGEQTWKQLRLLEAQSRRSRNWRVAAIVAALALVYALAAYFYIR